MNIIWHKELEKRIQRRPCACFIAIRYFCYLTANFFCFQRSHVFINDKQAKAGTEVKVGDIILIKFGTRDVKVEVTSVQETVKKEEAKEMYKEL